MVARVTISAGSAAVEAGNDADDLIRAADAALYAARRLGGNSVARFTPGLRRNSRPEPAQPA